MNDASAFYSKLSEIEYFQNAYNQLVLEMKYDDKGIVEILGGPLKQKCSLIKVWITNGEPNHLSIKFSETCLKSFDGEEMKDISYKDIDEFVSIRGDKGGLMKIRVKYDNHAYVATYDPLPKLWSHRFIPDLEDRFSCDDYVGPATDGDLLRQMNDVYKDYADEDDITICVIDVEDHDILRF